MLFAQTRFPNIVENGNLGISFPPQIEWTNPTQASSIDGLRAEYFHQPEDGNNSKTLIGYDFNFNLPSGAYVRGIAADIYGYQYSTGAPDNLLINTLALYNYEVGFATAYGNKVIQLPFPSALAHRIYGSSTDRWEVLEFIRGYDVNSELFGLGVSASYTDNEIPGSALIDSMAVTVYYWHNNVSGDDEDIFPFYIAGGATHNSGLPLYTVGGLPSNSGIPLYYYGYEVNNSGIPLFVWGNELNTSGIPLYTSASAASDSGIPLFVGGTIYVESGIPLYTFGVGTVEASSIPLFIDGLGYNESGIPLYLPGAGDPTSGSIPLFIEGPVRCSGDIPMYVSGIGYYSDAIPLFIWGNTNWDSGVPMYISGDPSSWIPLYTWGHDVQNSSIPLNIWGNSALDGTGIPLHISGVYYMERGLPLFLHAGTLTSSGNNIPLMLMGNPYSASGSDYLINTIPLYINSPSYWGEMPLFLQGATTDTTTNSAYLYISGALPSITNHIPLYISNSGTSQGIPLYVYGAHQGRYFDPYVSGGLPYEAGLNLFIRFAPYESIPMFICSNIQQSGMYLYTQGALGKESGIPLYMKSHDVNNQSVNLFTFGF